jgi:hypothetical protein
MSERREILPIARYTPTRGIVVDRSNMVVTITGAMELFGPEASPTRALWVQNSINSAWTRSFADGRSVKCQILVRYRPPGVDAGYATQVEALKAVEDSGVSGRPPARKMTLNVTERGVFTWIVAHEFGHIIGLRDRYVETILSEIRATWGGRRQGKAEAGYTGNIMADAKGSLFPVNATDIARENAPGWFEDDDQVRDWIKGHTLFEIRQLPSATKLAALKTLTSGWISGEDLAAMRRICGCAGSKEEADAIRKGVDLLAFTDLGQRAQMRVALANMPY